MGNRRFRRKRPNWCITCEKKPEKDCFKKHDLMRKQTNYEKGRSVEYKVIKALRSQGCYCIRAYGSYGIYDVIACPPKKAKDHRTLLIQVKAREELLKPIEKESLIEVGRTLAGRTMVAFNDEKGHLKFKEFDTE